MIPSLLVIFAEQVLNPDLDITGSGDVQNPAEVYLSEQKARSVPHRQTV